MYLLSIDNISLMGLPQEDILFILNQKKQKLREIILSSSVSIPKIPNSQTRNSLPKLNSSLLEKSSSVTFSTPSPASSPAHSLVHDSASTSSSSLVSAASSSSVSSSRLNSKTINSSTSLPHYHSAMTASTPSLRSRNIASSSASPSTPNDPFSTPARRRRLIADIARFLLRQYCVKACEQVAYDRHRQRCAVTIQCFLRQSFARKVLRRLRFARDTKQSLVIQRFYRCLIAREQLQDRIRNRWRAKYRAMVLRVQKKYRQYHHTKRYQLMLSSGLRIQRVMRVYQRRMEWKRRKLAEELRKQKQEQAAIQIQSQYRAHRARVRYQELFVQYCHQKMMKFRILQSWRWSQQRKREAATLLIQCQFRILQSKRRAAKIQKTRLQESEERAKMAAEDLRSRYIHEHTTELTMCLHINTALASRLRQFQISQFLIWCIQHHLLCFDSIADLYIVGPVIRNLLVHWKETQRFPSNPHNDTSPPSARIEISNTSVQTDTPSSLDLISYPDSLQCPLDWGKKYPIISSMHQSPQALFRPSINRWGQVILSFDNFVSWSHLLGENSRPSLDSSSSLYNLRVVLGERELDYNPEFNKASLEQEEKMPELEFHELEVVITVVTVSPTSSEIALDHHTGMNSRQVVCRIESDAVSSRPTANNNDSVAFFSDGSQVTSQSEDCEAGDNDLICLERGTSGGDGEYEELIGEDISSDDTALAIEPVSMLTSQPLSRPNTATTRLYITAPPVPRAPTEEEILESDQTAMRGKMIPVFEELLHKVKVSYLRKRQGMIDEFLCRIMVSRIQVLPPSPIFPLILLYEL